MNVSTGASTPSDGITLNTVAWAAVGAPRQKPRATSAMATPLTLRHANFRSDRGHKQYSPKVMLLVVDVGNTQTHLGTYRDGELVQHWRFATVRESTADELGAALRNLLALRGMHLEMLDGMIVSSTVPQLRPEWTAMGAPLPRRRDARWSAPGCGPGCRSATTTRARSAPTGSSTRSPATRRSAGRAWSSTSAPRSPTTSSRAGGEYLGGIIFPGVEISMEALTERAAALPKIDLGTPRALIGKTTIDAIRSGIVFGYAGHGRRHPRAPARRAGRGDARARHRRPGERDRAVLRRRSSEVDDLLTLNGPAADLGAEPAPRLAGMRSLHDPWTLGGLTIPNRVVLAPLAGIGNWFVRLQAKRYGAGLAVSRDGLELRDPLRQPRTLDELLRHPPRRARGRAGVDPAVRPRPGDHALGRRDGRARGRRPDRPQHGLPGAEGLQDRRGRRAARATPTRAVAVARAAREGSGLPVTVKLRAGRKPGEREGVELAHRLVEEAGVAGISFHPRSRRRAPQGHARLRARRASSSRRCPCR